MRSPFKFLDAYTLRDRDVFFGREKEIEALYTMVYETPLILVYGESGTGKTSLIQCGLASRFDGPDWLPFFIRRQEDVNQSLSRSLRKKVDGRLPPAVDELFRRYLRPVYLIFDQLEELFILGSAAEQQQFMQDIQDLLNAGLPSKVLLVIREEYLGQLYNFERVIPSLFDFRLRVEPMSATRVKEVMVSSFNKFNISLAGDEEERLQEMLDNISGGRSGIQLPYLQVYLDRLYREDYKRTYGNRERAETLPPLQFSKEEIEELGRIEEVLEKFLAEQRIELQQELERTFTPLPEEFAGKVLDVFVTAEGTKRPVYYRREGDLIEVDEKIREMMPPVEAVVLSDCLNALQERRILRFEDDSIELAHDSLAELIDRERTDEQRQLNEIFRRIKQNYQEHLQTGDFLSLKQLTLYEEYLPKLHLKPQEEQFIADSHRHVRQLELEKQRQQQREIELEQQKKTAKRRRQLLVIIAALAVVAIVAGIQAWIERGKAVVAKDQLELANESLKRETLDKLMATAQSSKVQGNYEQALLELNDIQAFVESNNIAGPVELDSLQEQWNQLAQFMEQGDRYNQNDRTLPLALEEYEKAYSIAQDSIISLKITQTKEKIENRVEVLLNQTEMFIRTEELGLARGYLNYAARLKPGDSRIRNLKAQYGW